MVSRLMCFGLLTAILPAISGCGAILNLLGAQQTTIRIVNNASAPVRLTMFISNEQDIPEFLLDEQGERVERTVEANSEITIIRDCDDLQAVQIDDADLQLLGNIGPETSSEVFRDGSDFNCGDTIRFTFTGTLLSLDVDFSRQ